MDDWARIPSGPLVGVRIVELAGMGPAPFGAMILADLGAEVVRVSPPGAGAHRRRESIAGDVITRSRRNIAIDLKQAPGRALLLELIKHAEAFIEPFRPGVAERLGIGPDNCLAVRPSLAYVRMTGWGQVGPLASAPGHDINFVALSGALDAIGPRGGPPVVPLNLVGDFGGGGMLLAIGLLAALHHARATGQGQVVDVSMLDGATALMATFFGRVSDPRYNGPRGTNLLDGGAWFYGVYETADHKYIAVGAIEPQFCKELAARVGLEDEGSGVSQDPANWVETRRRLQEIFRRRTRAEWCEFLEGTDACFSPVLSVREAPRHPHHVARSAFMTIDDVVQPAPVPRFSTTPGAVQCPPARPGAHTQAVLADWLGMDASEVTSLHDQGVIG